MSDVPDPGPVTQARLDAVKREVELHIKHVREAIESGFASRDKALITQAVEYERRLELLNNNLRMILDERLTRDKFDAFVAEYRRAHDDVSNRITAVESSAKTWITAVGIGLLVLTLALRYV